VTGYDGSSWGTPQYITRNGSPEGTLNTNVKFGQTFDISGDGDYLISSFFGEDPTYTLSSILFRITTLTVVWT